MTSYITCTMVVIATILVGIFSLGPICVATFSFTMGAFCTIIGLVEIKIWQIYLTKSLILLDGVLQMFIGISGLICGTVILLLAA